MAKVTPEKPEGEQMSESYISVGLGLLVVVVVGILLYNYFTQKNSQKTETSSENITEEATSAAKPGSTYTVTDGDTLWSISEKSYGTGYNWEDIAKANNLIETDQLTAGQQLMIPEVSPKLPETETTTTIEETAPVAVASPETIQVTQEAVAPPTPQASPQASITGTTYLVAAGDTLWDIACRAYGDCYAWPKIVQTNSTKIVDPNLIYAGDTLNLPR